MLGLHNQTSLSPFRHTSLVCVVLVSVHTPWIPDLRSQVATLLEYYGESISAEEIARVESIEEFDEFEEWCIKCQHYFVLVATQGGDDTTWKQVNDYIPSQRGRDRDYSGTIATIEEPHSLLLT